MKKLNNSEDELKKGVLIKKACILGKKMKKKIYKPGFFVHVTLTSTNRNPSFTSPKL